MPLFSNGKQSIPDLFIEIMRNDNQRAAFTALPVVNLAFWKELKDERVLLTRSAENMLCWNKDKGKK